MLSLFEIQNMCIVVHKVYFICYFAMITFTLASQFIVQSYINIRSVEENLMLCNFRSIDITYYQNIYH